MRRSATDTGSRTVGNQKTTATYTADGYGFGYTVITDDIKADFNFLTEDIPAKLDEMLNEFENASSSAAFQIVGSNSVNDLSTAKAELTTDVSNMKTSLTALRDAFWTDIDNINAELAYNFGWILIGDVHGSERTTTVETADK
jgi:hypothetical protein